MDKDITEEGGFNWVAKPLSLRNTTRLIRLIAGQLIRKTILEAPALQGASDSEVLGAVLEALDEDALAELISIGIDQPVEVVKENYNAGEAMASLVQFFRLNDFGRIWGEARNLGGAGQARKKKKR
jgi:hypothetical protein